MFIKKTKRIFENPGKIANASKPSLSIITSNDLRRFIKDIYDWDDKQAEELDKELGSKNPNEYSDHDLHCIAEENGRFKTIIEVTRRINQMIAAQESFEEGYLYAMRAIATENLNRKRPFRKESKGNFGKEGRFTVVWRDPYNIGAVSEYRFLKFSHLHSALDCADALNAIKKLIGNKIPAVVVRGYPEEDEETGLTSFK